MFGNMWGLWNLNQLKEVAKVFKEIEDVRKTFPSTYIKAYNDKENKDLYVMINLKGELKEIKILDDSLLSPDKKEELEKRVTNAFNKAQQVAGEKIQERFIAVLSKTDVGRNLLQQAENNPQLKKALYG